MIAKHFNIPVGFVVLMTTLLLPLTFQAQTDVSLDPELGARASFTLDKKLARGLHLRLDEEVRFDNNFSSFDRLHTTLSLRYKPVNNLRLGVGYALITPYSSSNSAFKNIRHRMMVDASYGYRFGDWRLSLKERLQMTVRTGDFNEYQNPQMLLALKSRLMLQYKGMQQLEPYGYVELRTPLNAYTISAVYNEDDGYWYTDESCSSLKGDAGWFISGRGAYLDRIRGAIGASWQFSKSSTVDFSLMLDHVSDKVIDANAEGTKLKSYTLEKGFVGWLNINYQYSF